MDHRIAVLTLLGRVGLAVLLAGLVGLERELADQPAGLRTHTLVALGAALFTVAGTEVAGTDPTRVAAQVVTGVGFLGGGAILREGMTIRGLTTAATLWVVAAIGLAAGLGAYAAAVATTAAALLVTVGVRQVEREIFPRRRGQLVTLDVEDPSLSAVVVEARRVLGQARVAGVTSRGDGVQRVTLDTKLSERSDLTGLAERLLRLTGVVGVDLHR